MSILFSATSCWAEVVSTDPNGFQLRHSQIAKKDVAHVYLALVNQVGKWWSPEHTYTGDSANLSLDLKRGWLIEQLSDGGFVRHMDLVYLAPRKQLRLLGGLGPLQEMAVNGALTIKLTETKEGTKIEWIYNVSGNQSSQLDRLASIVDKVQAEFLNGLVNYCEKS